MNYIDGTRLLTYFSSAYMLLALKITITIIIMVGIIIYSLGDNVTWFKIITTTTYFTSKSIYYV